MEYFSRTDLPILLIAYSRPALLESSLRRLTQISDSRIYIAIDGVAGEADRINVEQTRKVGRDYVNQVPESKLLVEETNLGCKDFPKKAISWFFTNEDAGIILEDDIVISRSFLCFSKTYIFQESVSIVSSCSYPELVPEIKNEEAFLTRIPSIWGWATTKDLWSGYILHESLLPKSFPIISLMLAPKIGIIKALLFGLCLRQVNLGKLQTWDYPFALYLILNKKYTLLPSTRLSCNIGFGPRATHNEDCHNPTLPFIESDFRYLKPKLPLYLSKIYQSKQALNTPFYPEFRVQVLKGLVRYLLDPLYTIAGRSKSFIDILDLRRF